MVLLFGLGRPAPCFFGGYTLPFSPLTLPSLDLTSSLFVFPLATSFVCLPFTGRCHLWCRIWIYLSLLDSSEKGTALGSGDALLDLALLHSFVAFLRTHSFSPWPFLCILFELVCM